MTDIALCGVSKAYAGLPVLQALCHTFPAGRTSCVAGPSGAGKTTLLRLLMGLEVPDAGSIGGLWGQRLSAVFQENRLCLNLSAVANVEMVCQTDAAREDGRALLARLGLEGHVHQPVRQLSGGMQRRVALARALVADYDVLLMDEPFKGLDDALKDEVLATTHAATAGKTVVFVTHDLTEAAALNAEVLTLPLLAPPRPPGSAP